VRYLENKTYRIYQGPSSQQDISYDSASSPWFEIGRSAITKCFRCIDVTKLNFSLAQSRFVPSRETEEQLSFTALSSSMLCYVRDILWCSHNFWRHAAVQSVTHVATSGKPDKYVRGSWICEDYTRKVKRKLSASATESWRLHRDCYLTWWKRVGLPTLDVR
jgi:hypothetical protein